MSSEWCSDQDVYQLIMVDEQQYALPVDNIIRIAALENVLPLPETPAWLPGVVHIRNAIVPVINLNQLLNVSPKTRQNPYPLVVLLQHSLNVNRWLALCVNEFTELLHKEDAAEMATTSPDHPCFKAVVNHLMQKIYLPDIDALFEQLTKGPD
ncbi:chemotaxis protein CheW [Methylophaga pinxianii]|uniref:chemotaxis protein CheW n=1 Tax=Methylophaga pinxianii TaxID=2881052 RepID=UPI001CF476D4|nr:chemotaxis protein CheW [Methylophaga pinxianii]MCB2427810.1 chemotaxis protein CheW [Methylophaga pinxianii]UPH45586.1 chemotaxis protein CheW [Methylophaga pinxianii]